MYEYGNKNTAVSPWNPYAATSPLVVDTRGNSYGYLTLNKSQSDRFDNSFTPDRRATIRKEILMSKHIKDPELLRQQMYSDSMLPPTKEDYSTGMRVYDDQ